MRKTTREIILDVESHLACSKKKYYSDFYIEITNDVDRRLFGEHNVDKNHSWWIYRTAVDKATAQAVEEHFLSKGMREKLEAEHKILSMCIVMRLLTPQKSKEYEVHSLRPSAM